MCGLRVRGRCVTRFLYLKEEDNVSGGFFFFFFLGKDCCHYFRGVNNPSTQVISLLIYARRNRGREQQTSLEGPEPSLAGLGFEPRQSAVRVFTVLFIEMISF